MRSSRLRVAILAIFCALAAASDAHAAKAMFGTREFLRKLEDTTLTAGFDRLYLGHKFSHHAFILPYSLSDDGYILGVVGKNSYMKLDADQIADLQAKGQLPKPLPPYEIGVLDYAMGYLAWIVLAAVAVSIVIGSWRSQKNKKAVPFFARALEHHEAGRGEAALADYEKALAIDPAHPLILGARGNLYAALGRLDEALTDFSRIIKADPKNTGALLGRGELFLRKGQTGPALSDFTRAVKASKGAEAYHARGQAYLQAGDAGAAIKDFTAAIKRAPEAAVLFAARASAHAAAGDAASAAADTAAAERLAPPPAAPPSIAV